MSLIQGVQGVPREREFPVSHKIASYEQIGMNRELRMNAERLTMKSNAAERSDEVWMEGFFD